MKILLLLVMSIIWTTEGTGCPSKCDCIQSSVVCINKGLKRVPSFEGLEDEPRIIDLSGNQISLIDDENFSFARNNEVREIYLNNSELFSIDSSSFEELQNLQELYLGENLLTSIPEDIIEDLPNMILLEMSQNLFSGEMPLIKSKSLKFLTLANSKISKVSEDSLKYLPSLTLLVLQANNIKSISPNVFTYVTSESLALKLSYNPWQCSCENFELFEFLDSKKYIDKTDPLTCISDDIETTIFENGSIEKIKSMCLKGNIVNDETVKKKLQQLSENAYSLIKNDSAQVPLRVEEGNQSLAIINVKQISVEAIENLEEPAKPKECLQFRETSQLFHTYHLEIIVLLTVFAMGIFLGCFLNHIMAVSKYTKLKQSETSLYT